MDFCKVWKNLTLTPLYLQKLIQLLKESKHNQCATIAKCCIKALYEYNESIFMGKIFKVIAAPFFIAEKKETTNNNILYNEEEVSESIEIIFKCFITDDLNFKQLPTKILIPIVLPIFCLYVKCKNSISIFKSKIKQLILKIFEIKDIREEMFSLILDYDVKVNNNYGTKINFQLGESGNFQVMTKYEDTNQEEFSNALFDLINNDEILSINLFNFLLKSCYLKENSTNVLETNLDVINRMAKQLVLVDLLIQLANLSTVQNNCLNNPKLLLSFVKSFLEKQKNNKKDTDEMDIGYIGLMLVKVILNEGKYYNTWSQFDEFISYLSMETISKSLSSNTKKLIEEIKDLINMKEKVQRKNFDDLSSIKPKSDFDKALEDLSDRLLPVQAHGLIALTKLIEKGDGETLMKKDVLVCIFQENLKHEDSFLYLAAVNGLCALALRYPKDTIDILIQEFINMPHRSSDLELSLENRVKFGEIFVKVTRNMGEMAIVYRNQLINCFLCVIRDPDPLVCASSLSCLGELCKILGFRLGNITEEVIYCIGQIIQFKKEPECRRAAVMVITLLLRGLRKDILTSISHHLLNLYRCLKFIRDNDKDDIIRLHAQLALEEIDDIVKKELCFQPKLEKKISLIFDN